MQIDDIAERLAAANFLFVDAARVVGLLSDTAQAPIGDDLEFLGSWDRLERDRYMADGGKYRKRRHAVYTIQSAGEQARLMPRQAFAVIRTVIN